MSGPRADLEDELFRRAKARDEEMAMDPLTAKGNKIKSAMEKEYGAKKGESVFYASKNKGIIKGVDAGYPKSPTSQRHGTAIISHPGHGEHYYASESGHNIGKFKSVGEAKTFLNKREKAGAPRKVGDIGANVQSARRKGVHY